VTPSQRVADVIPLLNYALMRAEPLGHIVFAVSAVESLGQDESWSNGRHKRMVKPELHSPRPTRAIQ